MFKRLPLFSLALCFFTFPLFAQMQRAIVEEDYIIRVERTDLPDMVTVRGTEIAQLPGYPKGFPAHPNFKNFRNVTLADLTGDGVEEILLATNRTLYVFANATLLWSKPLLGAAIYPPSVADMDGDGLPEIVQLTGGVNEQGRLYVMDRNGQDLPNFPRSFNDRWLLSAPALADMNGDGRLEIIACERLPPAGRIQVITLAGQSLPNFPVALDRTPAVTPSVGDVDGDGSMDIVVASTETFYIIGQNGQIKAQRSNPEGQRYSYQSPILVDLDNRGTLDIVGATHGNLPQFYVLDANAQFRPGWPIPVPDNNWTYSTPSLIRSEEAYTIMMSRPIGETTNDMLFAWDKDGQPRAGFPIVETGGQEGIISVADVNDDHHMDILFGSNLLGTDGRGFIHAHQADGGGPIAGFPLRPRGWTLLNGANIGDVNGDGQMDLVVLSYTLNFGAAQDSVYLNVYTLPTPYTPDRVWWRTYKGDNTRSGLLTMPATTPNRSRVPLVAPINMRLQQNPVTDYAPIQLNLAQGHMLTLILYDNLGRPLRRVFQGQLEAGQHQMELAMTDLPAGIYRLQVLHHRGVATLSIVKM